MFSLVAMVLPSGLGGLTTIRSGILVIVAGIAIGWGLSWRYFTREPVASGGRGLHFPVTYQFEDYASWRYRWLSLLDALAYCLETLGQAGWLVLMPLHRLTAQRARKSQTR